MIKRALILLLLALAPLVVSGSTGGCPALAEPLLPNLPGQAQPSATALSRPDLRLLRSDERGVVLEFGTPVYALTPVCASYRLTIPGVGLTASYFFKNVSVSLHC